MIKKNFEKTLFYMFIIIWIVLKKNWICKFYWKAKVLQCVWFVVFNFWIILFFSWIYQIDD